MRSKKLITAFTACALLLVSTSFVQANPFRSHANDTYNLSSEKAENVGNIYEKGQVKIQPLRDELYAKRLELKTLAQNPSASPEAIKELAQNISELRSNIREQKKEIADSIDEETGTRNFMANNHRNSRSNGNGHNGNGHNSRSSRCQ